MQQNPIFESLQNQRVVVAGAAQTAIPESMLLVKMSACIKVYASEAPDVMTGVTGLSVMVSSSSQMQQRARA